MKKRMTKSWKVATLTELGKLTQAEFKKQFGQLKITKADAKAIGYCEEGVREWIELNLGKDYDETDCLTVAQVMKGIRASSDYYDEWRRGKFLADNFFGHWVSEAGKAFYRETGEQWYCRDDTYDFGHAQDLVLKVVLRHLWQQEQGGAA